MSERNHRTGSSAPSAAVKPSAGRLAVWLLSMPLLLVMTLCLSLVIQAARQPDRLPTILGHKPLFLQSERAPGALDLGIIRVVDPNSLKEQDPVAYKDKNAYYVEPVNRIENAGGSFSVLTGSASGEPMAQTSVAAAQIEGLLVYRIPKAGSWMLFIQSPAGMLIFMLATFLSMSATDPLRRRRLFRHEPAPVNRT